MLKEYRASQWCGPLFLVSILVLVFLMGLPSLVVPFGRDQGVAALVASYFLDGYVPYKDIWDQKPPGLSLIYALAFSLFGRSMISVNLFDLLFRLLTVLAFYHVSRRLHGQAAGFISAFLYGTFSTLKWNHFWYIAQKETFMLLPLLLSTYLCMAWKENKSSPYLVLSGFFAAVACYLKPSALTAFVFVVLVVTISTFRARKGKGSLLLRNVGYLMLGFIAAWIPFLAYLLFHHALGEMVNAVFLFNIFYASSAYGEGILDALGNCMEATYRFVRATPSLSILTLGGLAIVLVKERSWKNLFVIGWLAFVLLSIWAQGKFFWYHWIPLVGPFVLLAAYGTVGLYEVDWDKKKYVGRGLYVAILLLAAALIWGDCLQYYHRVQRELSFVFGREPFTAFAHKYRMGKDFSFLADVEVAKYIESNTSPNDPIEIWGFEPLIYFLAQRKAASRYFCDLPLTANWSYKPAYVVDYQTASRRIFMREISAASPIYILVVKNDTNPLEPVDSLTQLQSFPEFAGYLSTDYFLEANIEDFYIYRRRGP